MPDDLKTPIFLICVGAVVLFFVALFRRMVHQSFGQPAGRLIRKLARRHGDVLAEKWLRCHRLDEYGQPDRAQWLMDMKYFIQSVALPAMTDFQRQWATRNPDGAKRCYEIITEVAAKHAPKMKTVAPASETAIAAMLRQEGWNVTAAPGETAGLIAEKAGMRVAIQAAPPGAKNPAAGDLTVVVPDTNFVSPAEQLAQIGTAVLIREELERPHHHGGPR